MADSPFPNPGAGIEAIRLANGHWALVYNDLPGDGTRWPSRSLTMKERAGSGRGTSSVAAPGKGQFHYPSMLQSSDGSIHVTYTDSRPGRGSTIEHARFNEAWIMAGRQEIEGADVAEQVAAIAGWRLAARYYPWIVVGLLWFCGFFNYADRQAVSAVFPLLKSEFDLNDTQLGYAGLGVHARLCADVAVFRLHGRSAVAPAADSAGTGVLEPDLRGHGVCSRISCNWSSCAAAEGLGESFYFPASMSVLADYHGPRTRSRAMSIHQTSVYLGTAGGLVSRRASGRAYGWRSPFWVLGLGGHGLCRVARVLSCFEPARSSTEGAAGGRGIPADGRRGQGIAGFRRSVAVWPRSLGS